MNLGILFALLLSRPPLSSSENDSKVTSVPVETAEQLEQHFTAVPRQFVLVGFFQNAESEQLQIFKDLRPKFPTLSFFHTTDLSTRKHYKVHRAEAAVQLFVPLMVNHHKYNQRSVRWRGGPLSAAAIETWLNEQSMGIDLNERTKDNDELWQTQWTAGTVVLTVFMRLDYDINQKEVTYYLNRIHKVNSALEGRVRFLVAEKQDFKQEMEKCKAVGEASGPRDVAVCARQGARWYLMTSAFGVDSLTDFALSVSKGNQIPVLDTEEIEKQQKYFLQGRVYLPYPT